MNSSPAVLLFLLCIIFLIIPAGQTGCSRADSLTEVIYVGTFDHPDSEGMYIFQFNRKDETLTPIQTIRDRKSPNFQAIHPNSRFLYSVSNESFTGDVPHETVSAYRIDPDSGKLTLINEQMVKGRDTCHISVHPDGNFVYVSNYSSGDFSVFGIRDDGDLSESIEMVRHSGGSVNPQRQQGPHVHSIIPSPDGKFLYVSDLGMDKIMIYAVDREDGRIVPASQTHVESTPGAGPRHFVMHPNGRFAWVAEELSSTVAVFQVDRETGALEPIQRISMLPDGFNESSSAADIHVSPDGKFLYASNRGHDSIVIYSINESSGELTLVGHEPTLGGHPRNFRIDPAGEFLFVANRDDNNVVLFRRDVETGKLQYTGTQVEVPYAVSVTPLILQ